MNQKKVHPTPDSASDSFSEELEDGDGVEAQTDDEQDGVGDNGDNLCLPKHHVLWDGEV